MSTSIAIGTRGSALALRQTEMFIERLRAVNPDVSATIVTIQTEADRRQDRSIASLGDKGVFVRAIERAQLDGRVDCAVHSLKDVPSDTSIPGLRLAAFLPREDPRDVLVSAAGAPLDALPSGSRIGTSSPRRRLLLRELRPDLHVLEIRGNVDTRLRKLDSGEYDALVLAAAGLLRLGRGDRITEYLDPAAMVPDAGQGIIAVQCRDEPGLADLLARVDDPDAHGAAVAERAVVQALGAGCLSPVGAYARRNRDSVDIRAVAASSVDSPAYRMSVRGSWSGAEEVGRHLGLQLLAALDADGDHYTEP